MVNFFDLTPETLPGFIDEAKRYTGLWFFQHIPKTAGSSLVGDLQEHAKPFRDFEFDYTVPPGANFREHRKNLALHILNDHRTKPYRAMSGHYVRTDVNVFRDAVDTRVFTFLRHPVQRIVSEYNYSLSDMHPLHEAFAERYPTIEHFIDDESRANSIYQFLCTAWSAPQLPEEQIMRILRREIFFFGLQEYYELSYMLLSSFIWEPTLPSGRQARKLSNDDTKRTYAKYHDLICDRNANDLFIYEQVDAVFQRIAERAEEILRPQVDGSASGFKPTFSFSKR